MTTILKLVDDVLETSARTRQKAAGEASAIKEASALPRCDLARELHAVAASLRSDNNALTYADLGSSR